MKMNRNTTVQNMHISKGIAKPMLSACAVDGLFYRQIEKPLLGVFVFAKRGEPLLPTKEAKKD